MDRSWIKTPYISDNYQKGVEDLLQFAQQNAPVLVVKYFFPCVKCVNGRHQSLNDINASKDTCNDNHECGDGNENCMSLCLVKQQ